MVRYAVLGLGLMGSAIIYDLLSSDTTSEVFGLDISAKQIQNITERFLEYENRLFLDQIEFSYFDSPDQHPFVEYLKENQILTVFGAIDYKFNVLLTQICINAGCNYLDLGGNPDVVQQQRTMSKKAKIAGVTIIPDCGLAPGLANIFAAHGINKFESVDTCHIRVGGLPQRPKTILKYQQVFSIRGLTNEYLEDAIVLRNGNLETIKSLTGFEKLVFPDPWGELEAFNTAGGASSLPELFKGKIRELTYKTIRFHGHGQFFLFLKELGLLSSESYPKLPDVTPRELIEYYLEKYLPQNEPDVVLVRIIITGIKNTKQYKLILELIDLADSSSGFSAMARTTAFPTSIIGQMVTNNIIVEKGVLYHELAVPEKEFKDELQKRNIIFSEIYL